MLKMTCVTGFLPHKNSLPSAVSIRLDLLDPLCMPLTIPEGGRSIFAGRIEEDDDDEEVVVVTSGGAEKFSKRGEKKLELYYISSKIKNFSIFFFFGFALLFSKEENYGNELL